jgi:hypothetical protein
LLGIEAAPELRTALLFVRARGGESQGGENRQTWVSPSRLARTRLQVKVDAALSAESVAVFTAQGLTRQRQESLFAYQRREIDHLPAIETGLQFLVIQLQFTAEGTLWRENHRELPSQREGIFF